MHAIAVLQRSCNEYREWTRSTSVKNGFHDLWLCHFSMVPCQINDFIYYVSVHRVTLGFYMARLMSIVSYEQFSSSLLFEDSRDEADFPPFFSHLRECTLGTIMITRPHPCCCIGKQIMWGVFFVVSFLNHFLKCLFFWEGERES